MQQLHITMAGGFYDRTRAIIDGSVRPEGLTLSYIELPIEEVFWRVLRYGEFDIAECSLAYCFMVGEIDRRGLVRATHRLMEEGVESPALLALSLVNQNEDDDPQAAIGRLMNEIGLGGWDAGQAGQLLALHAAASILGEVSQPIDGARRISTVSSNAQFTDLVDRWISEPDHRDGLNAEIRRAAAELFGPPDERREER